MIRILYQNVEVILQSFKLIKLAISRALYEVIEEKYQKQLKKEGFLTRDPRCKERRSVNYFIFIQTKIT